MTTATEYAFISMGAYVEGTGTPAGLELDQEVWVREQITFEPSDLDFGAAVYRNVDTGEVVIAYRGADQGWLQLGQTALDDEIHSQALDAYRFYLAVRAQLTTDNITFTGHSLGSENERACSDG